MFYIVIQTYMEYQVFVSLIYQNEKQFLIIQIYYISTELHLYYVLHITCQTWVATDEKRELPPSSSSVSHVYLVTTPSPLEFATQAKQNIISLLLITTPA